MIEKGSCLLDGAARPLFTLARDFPSGLSWSAVTVGVKSRGKSAGRGQIGVGAQATLAGTLKVNTGSGFTPAHGQTFAVLLYHTRSGTFGALTGHPTYTIAYRATAAKVKY